MNLNNITWQSMDDILETRNENGHLKANILFSEEGTLPGVEEMDGFKRVLCFVKGKVRGSNIHRTEVLLTEENNYSEVHPIGQIGGEYEVVGLDTERVRYSLGENGITISKSSNLTTPGTYTTVFAFVG